MEYRTLGKTGLNVSALSFGASSLGGVFRDVGEDEGIRTVHTALDLGINFIDVAPYYGLTRAEQVLGKALRTVPRDRYMLATKVGRYGDVEADFDFSAPRVTRSVDESLARLGVDHVDLIQCHDIEFGSLDQIVEQTLPALHRLRDQGKVRFVGITGLPLKVFTVVLERAPQLVDTILSYCHYCLNDTSLTRILPELERRGVGVVNASPTGMGLLTARGAPAWHPAPAEVRAACRRAVEHCERRGVNLTKLAMQFALAQPRIATTLVGTASPRNIADNVRWVGEPMDRELLAEVQALLEPVRDRTWPSGRAENN